MRAGNTPVRVLSLIDLQSNLLKGNDPFMLTPYARAAIRNRLPIHSLELLRNKAIHAGMSKRKRSDEFASAVGSTVYKLT